MPCLSSPSFLANAWLNPLPLTVDVALPRLRPAMRPEPLHPPSLFASLPADVAGMVRDEALLLRTRNTLERELESHRQALRQSASPRAWLSAVFLSSRRRLRRAQRQDLRLAIASAQPLLERAVSSRQRLSPSVRAALADHLGHLNPTYRQGLRAARYHEHWLRHHRLLCESRVGLVRELRHFLDTLSHDASRDLTALSPLSRWQLRQTQAVASTLERELADLNHIARLHEALVADTPFASARLPALLPWTNLAQLFLPPSTPPAKWIPALAELFQDFSEHKPAILTSQETLFREACAFHSALAENLLVDTWESLLAYAEVTLPPGPPIPELLTAIEQRQFEAERRRFHAPARVSAT